MVMASLMPLIIASPPLESRLRPRSQRAPSRPARGEACGRLTVRPQTVGVDFALATLPVAAAYGVLLLGADLDASSTVALTHGARLMPRRGLSSGSGLA